IARSRSVSSLALAMTLFAMASIISRVVAGFIFMVSPLLWFCGGASARRERAAAGVEVQRLLQGDPRARAGAPRVSRPRERHQPVPVHLQVQVVLASQVLDQ